MNSFFTPLCCISHNLYNSNVSFLHGYFSSSTDVCFAWRKLWTFFFSRIIDLLVLRPSIDRPHHIGLFQFGQSVGRCRDQAWRSSDASFHCPEGEAFVCFCWIQEKLSIQQWPQQKQTFLLRFSLVVLEFLSCIYAIRLSLLVINVQSIKCPNWKPQLFLNFVPSCLSELVSFRVFLHSCTSGNVFYTSGFSSCCFWVVFQQSPTRRLIHRLSPRVSAFVVLVDPLDHLPWRHQPNLGSPDVQLSFLLAKLLKNLTGSDCRIVKNISFTCKNLNFFAVKTSLSRFFLPHSLVAIPPGVEIDRKKFLNLNYTYVQTCVFNVS